MTFAIERLIDNAAAELGVDRIALRRKNLIAWKEWPVEPWLETAAAKDHVATFLRGVKPLREWLDQYVGPTEKVRERR